MTDAKRVAQQKRLLRSYTARARLQIRVLPTAITQYLEPESDPVVREVLADDIRETLLEAIGSLTAIAETLEIEL